MTDRTPAQRLLTVNEVAAKLGTTRYKIYRLIHTGEMPAVRNRPGGSRFRVPQSAVDDYLSGAHAVPVYVPEPNAVMLTVSDVARIFGCSAETVRRLVATGDLEAVRFRGKTSRIRIAPQALVDYQQRHQTTVAADEKSA